MTHNRTKNVQLFNVTSNAFQESFQMLQTALKSLWEKGFRTFEMFFLGTKSKEEWPLSHFFRQNLKTSDLKWSIRDKI